MGTNTSLYQVCCAPTVRSAHIFDGKVNERAAPHPQGLRLPRQRAHAPLPPLSLPKNNASARIDGIEHMACRAHVRRRFVEAVKVRLESNLQINSEL